MDQKGIGIVVLAAGLGKRMRSQTPKVLQEIGGKPLLFHVIKQIHDVSPGVPVAVVVGHGREKVEGYLRQEPLFEKMKFTFIHQSEPLGTGHAVRCVMDSPWGAERVVRQSSILVLPGDVPLITAELIAQMEIPLGKMESMRVLTCEVDDPTGYGRIVRRGMGGPILRIVEERDASPKEKLVREIGTSVYLFRADFLKAGIKRLSNNNAQKEYYLTDLVQQASSKGTRKKIGVLVWKDCKDLQGVNDLWELSRAGRELMERWMRSWAVQGVRFLDPASTSMDVSVQLAPGVVVYPGVVLEGSTKIGQHTVIGPHARLKDMVVGEHVHIKDGCVCESSQIESNCALGPYAHLRPNSRVKVGCKIGNFVELKNAVIGENTNVAHLSYLGDAEIGNKVNIGCGFITCNFDGRVIDGQRKHKTVIEDEVFMGSDCQVIAPIKVGRGAYIASGSTLSSDVEAGAFAIARARQVNKANYARKIKGNPCAE